MVLPADGVLALTCGFDVGVPAEDVFDGELGACVPVEDVPFTPAGEVELLVVVLLFEIEVLLDVDIPTFIGVFSANVLAAA
jgi:hypothetical protein